MKQRIRLTEGDLHRIVKESVRRVLKEDLFIGGDFLERLRKNLIGEVVDDEYSYDPYLDFECKKVDKETVYEKIKGILNVKISSVKRVSKNVDIITVSVYGDYADFTFQFTWKNIGNDKLELVSIDEV